MPPVQDLPLRDIHLPEQIGWFPPAIGWWLLMIVVPIASYFLIAFLQKIFKRTALKEAHQLLANLQTNDSLTPLEKICALSSLLRRVAISRDSEKNIGGLTGRAWLDYLDTSLEGAPFKNGVGRYLVDAPYQKNLSNDFDLIALFALANQWLKAQK